MSLSHTGRRQGIRLQPTSRCPSAVRHDAPLGGLRPRFVLIDLQQGVFPCHHSRAGFFPRRISFSSVVASIPDHSEGLALLAHINLSTFVQCHRGIQRWEWRLRLPNCCDFLGWPFHFMGQLFRRCLLGCLLRSFFGANCFRRWASFGGTFFRWDSFGCSRI